MSISNTTLDSAIALVRSKGPVEYTAKNSVISSEMICDYILVELGGSASRGVLIPANFLGSNRFSIKHGGHRIKGWSEYYTRDTITKPFDDILYLKDRSHLLSDLTDSHKMGHSGDIDDIFYYDNGGALRQISNDELTEIVRTHHTLSGDLFIFSQGSVSKSGYRLESASYSKYTPDAKSRFWISSNDDPDVDMFDFIIDDI